MQIKTPQVLLAAVIITSALVLFPYKVEKAVAPAPAIDTQAAQIEITPREFLTQEIRKQSLTEKDGVILSAIVQCESGWSQFWERDFKDGRKKGEVKVSNGNIGLFQINKGAHHAEYEKLGLDPYKEFDNIIYGVMLYKRGGIKAWEKWSGHCWKPTLAKEGIYFGLEAKAGQDGGQCVEFVQSLFKSNDKFRGRAADIQPNTDQPAVGLVVLTTEGKDGHAAYIYKMTDTELILAESNLGYDEKITVGRRLAINSPAIRGYFDFNKKGL